MKGRNVIEVCGLPASGKTSLCHYLVGRLREGGMRCAFVEEAAGRSPLHGHKTRWTFNAWTALQTVSALLVAFAEDYDVVVVDRGLVDAVCWLRWFRRRMAINPQSEETMERLVRLPEWWDRLDIVIGLSTEFENALTRGRSIGAIMNATAFQELAETYRDAMAEMRTVETLVGVIEFASADQKIEAIGDAVLADFRARHD